jgi:hypothetical protein
MEVYSQRLGSIKLFLRIISVLFLVWAILSKIDGMDFAANWLLNISLSIACFILVTEYGYGRLLKWGRSLQSQMDTEKLTIMVENFLETNKRS